MNKYLDINFDNIKTDIETTYHDQKDNNDGKVVTYIPELEKVDPKMFGISICMVNGEKFDIGDTDIEFFLRYGTGKAPDFSQEMKSPLNVHGYS